MPEATSRVEYRAEELEEAIDSRIPELKQKLKRLFKAQDGILVDAGNRILTKAEKKAIMKWMNKRGSEEEWPLDDNITLENYQARLAPYGVVDLIDTRHITGKNDIYNLVTRQYNAFAEELQRLKGQPKRFRVIGGQPAETPSPAAEQRPVSSELGGETTEKETEEDKGYGGDGEEEAGEELPPVVEHEFERPPHVAMSWKVWEMIFAMLHAMQKHPDQFEELKNLPPDALNKKLTEEGPRLVQEYMNIASRGAMEWEEEKKMWDVLDQTKLPNMDVKVGLLVLERAGFKVEVTPERLQLVPPGNEAAAKPFVLQFDTMDTKKRKWLEDASKTKGASTEQMHIESAESPDTDLEPGEYRVTVDHHTDDPRERKTSGAQLLYDYMLAAGMGAFKDYTRDPVLERLLAFTNANDNGEFPANRDFYLRSASTLWGIASDSRVPASVLYKIMARGRKPEDQLAEEDLNEAINEGLTVRELVAHKEKQIEKDAKEFDRWSREGYVVDSDYGPLYVCVETDGRYMPKQIAAKAYGGVPNVLIWTPEKHSFFIALGGGKSFKQDVKFPEGTEIIRRHLAIFKRQARTPQELTATLLEILYPFSPKKERQLRGDLRDYVFGVINEKFTSNETLFSIYTKMPERQEEVIKALVHYPQRLSGVKRLITETSGEAKRIYKEMFDRAQQRLAPPPPSGGPPPEPQEPPSPPPAPDVPATKKSDIEEASDILNEYKAQKAAGAAKKAKRKNRPRGANLRMDDSGEGSEG